MNFHPLFARRLTPSLAVILLLSLTFQGCKKDGPGDADSTFAFDSVSGFVITEEGIKLLATNAGLCSLDVARGVYEEVDNQLKGKALNDLACSFTSPEKEIWLASNEGACNFTRDEILNEANSNIQSDEVTQIGFNPGNTGFFASTGGLSLLNNETWSTYQGLNDFFLRHEISDIASASNGYTYVTTLGGGIERFKAGLDGVSGATLMDSDWTLLESNYVYSVYIDDTTQVYGTDRGVGFHFSEYTKWDWEVYTMADGLVNDTVLSVVRDYSGKWWIGTANGISMFDQGQWLTYTPGEYDLTGRRVKYLALDTDGSVWMASDHGLSHFTGAIWTAYPKASN